IEEPDDVHERRLARAGRAGDGDELAPPYRQRHAAQRAHERLAHAVGLINVAQFDHIRCARLSARLGDVQDAQVSRKAMDGRERPRLPALLAGEGTGMRGDPPLPLPSPSRGEGELVRISMSIGKSESTCAHAAHETGTPRLA